MLTVQNLLERKGAAVVTVDRRASVLEAARTMNAHRIGAVVVTDGGEVIGMFTERDILTRVVANDRPAAGTVVDEVMTKPVVSVERATPLEACQSLMTHQRIRHLPVLEDGKLIGLVSTGDILADQVARQDTTIHYLHEYIYGPGMGLAV